MANVKSPEWEDLSARKMGKQVLRKHPGKWLHLGTFDYKGGWSAYQKEGFKLAVRMRGPGQWDHYLMWPGLSEG